MRWVFVVSVLAVACDRTNVVPPPPPSSTVALAVAPPPVVAPPSPAAAPPPTVLWTRGPAILLHWITPREPWHAAEPIDWIVPVGTRVVVASQRGWIAIFDGATGAFSHERTFDAVYGAVDLGQGRVLVLVSGDEHVTATILDGTTLATLVEKPLPGDATGMSTSRPSVARVPNGPLAIALPGQPLALYDATTLKRTRVLAKGNEWTDVMATATSVYASRPNPKYLTETSDDPRDPIHPTIDARINHSTGKKDERGRHPHAVGRNITYQPSSNVGLGWHRDAVFSETSDVALSLADSPMGTTSAFSENGEIIAVGDDDRITLYSTTTGKIIESYPIARSNHFDHLGAPFRAIAFAGSSLYVAYEQEIRVVDLANHAVSPVPAPPSQSAHQLLVGNNGEVQTIDRAVARFANGARTALYSLPGDALVVASATFGSYGAYVFSNQPNTPSTLIAFRDGQVVKESPITEPPFQAWVTRVGTPGAWVSRDSDKQPLVEDLAGVQHVRTWSTDAKFDVDADTQIAITNGQLIDLRTGTVSKTPLDAPCKWKSQYRLERGGKRVVAWYRDTVFLLDRATNKQLATLQLPIDLRGDRGSEERPFEVTFLRGTDDIFIRGYPGFALWSPAKKELRAEPNANLRLATSPDGQSLAIVMGDGRVALAAYETFKAALAPEQAYPGRAPSCPSELF